MTTAPYSPAEGDAAAASSRAGLTALWFRTLVDVVSGTARIAGMLEAVQVTQIAELARTRRAEAVVEARDAVAEGRRFWSDTEAVERSIVDEVATALRVSTGVEGRRLADAESLVARPAILTALAEGHIHARAAYAIVEGVAVLSGEAAEVAEARVLAAAGRQTPAQVAAAVRRAVIAADPAAADRAYRRAVAARSARCRPEEDGMASIWISGTADRIARAWQTTTAVAEHRCHLAQASGGATEAATGSTGTGHPARVPTLDQARADAMLDLLSSPEGLPDPCGHTEPDSHPHPVGHVDLGDAASTDGDTPPDDAARFDDHAQPPDAASAGHAAGLRDGAGREQCAALPPMDVMVRLVLPMAALGGDPAELDGHGPVPPAFVADLLGGPPCPCRRDGPGADTSAATPTDSTDSTDRLRSPADAGRVRFTRWLVDAAGVVTTISQRVFTPYRPPPTLDATIRARDLTCRFPGCRTKARYCDIDHGIPYPAGATTAANLACLCRRHHRLKTHTRWQVTHRPGAVLEWTAPTGHTYLTYPPTWVLDQRQGSGHAQGSDQTQGPDQTRQSGTRRAPRETTIASPGWMFGRPGTPHWSPPSKEGPTPSEGQGSGPAASRPPGTDTADDVLPPF